MSDDEQRRSMDDVLVSLRRIMAQGGTGPTGAGEQGGTATGAVPVDEPAATEDEPLELTDAVDEPPLELTDAATEAPLEPAGAAEEAPRGPDEGSGDEASPTAGDDDGNERPVPAGEGHAAEGGEPVDDPLDLSDVAEPAIEDAVPEDASGKDADETGPRRRRASVTPADPEDAAAAIPASTEERAATPAAMTLPARLGEADAGPSDDTAEMEEMIRRVIRDELVQGEIGQNISRNVQRMIREEVERMLVRRGL